MPGAVERLVGAPAADRRRGHRAELVISVDAAVGDRPRCRRACGGGEPGRPVAAAVGTRRGRRRRDQRRAPGALPRWSRPRLRAARRGTAPAGRRRARSPRWWDRGRRCWLPAGGAGARSSARRSQPPSRRARLVAGARRCSRSPGCWPASASAPVGAGAGRPRARRSRSALAIVEAQPPTSALGAARRTGRGVGARRAPRRLPRRRVVRSPVRDRRSGHVDRRDPLAEPDGAGVVALRHGRLRQRSAWRTPRCGGPSPCDGSASQLVR